jgi:predicted transcriptional regulator
MTTLNIRLGGSIDDIRQRVEETMKRIDAGENVPDTESSYYFGNYDDMHRVLTPSRLAIVVTLAGQGRACDRRRLNGQDLAGLSVHR